MGARPIDAEATGLAPEDVLDAWLGDGGKLSERLERFEYRPQQLQMAQAVLKALAREQALIVEAGTGTGKTLAYLLPALLSGKRVLISTGTKALQEQLFTKDIPTLRAHFDRPFEAALLKGRRNYLCLSRMSEMMLHPRFRGHQDSKHWPNIMEWARDTELGDRAEVPGLPDDYATWADLSVSSEACKGSKCKFYESCFVTKARGRAHEADVVVVNHHLFFADLALRHTGYGEILPEFDAVIFDEAHHLEEVASNYFGVQVSTYRIAELSQDIRRAMLSEGVTDEDVEGELKAVGAYGTSLFTLLSFGQYDARVPLKQILRGAQASKIEEAHQKLARSLTALERALKRFAGSSELSERMAERAGLLKFDVDALLSADDERFIYIVEIKDRAVFLQAAPIDLAELFRTRLLEHHRALVFTSATLSTGGGFEYFKERLGMSPMTRREQGATEAYPVEELMLGHVFDYERQSLLYVPKKLPPPNAPQFLDGVVQIVEYLVGITGGRAFVLCTSWANMNAVYEQLHDRLGVAVFKQGERPKAELLQEFRDEPTSVLFATSSFWEGV
ncbi:MAG: ATP-dependent DNA helicase, partial [Myxococcota bacterium]